MREFATHHEILRTDLDDSPHRVLVVGAHNDDEKMLNLEGHLASRGVRVTRLTLTDGGGRNLPSLSSDELPMVRWHEGIQGARINGVAEVARIDAPDGHLEDYVAAALEYGEQFADGKLAIFAPNPEDAHVDHQAASHTALKLGGSQTTVYSMDTISGFGRQGNFLTPDFYVPLSKKQARREKRSYRAHKSQTEAISAQECPEMFSVLGMTKRRGAEIGLAHAAVVFHAGNTTHNPLESLIEVKRGR